MLDVDVKARDDAALSIVNNDPVINSRTADEWSNGRMLPLDKINTMKSVLTRHCKILGISPIPEFKFGMPPGAKNGAALLRRRPPPEVSTIHVNPISPRTGSPVDFGSALKSLLHESRHNYQFHIMDKIYNLDVDDLSLDEIIRGQKWFVANKNRKGADEFTTKQDVKDYLNSPLEADAETNARELVDAIERALGARSDQSRR